MAADLPERDRPAQVAHVADVDQLPARLFPGGLGVVVLRLALELGGIRIRKARDLADAVDPRHLGIGVVEQHPVPGRHLAHEVARLVVAHPGPRLGADAFQVVDRKIPRFGFHQPIALAFAHVAPAMKVRASVQTAWSGTSQGSRAIASTCCTANPAPTSQGGGADPSTLRNAKLRAYQPPPIPSRLQPASNPTSGTIASARSAACSSERASASGSGIPKRLATSGSPGFHGANSNRPSSP